MQDKRNIAAVVLSAGLSERMGRFKPLLPMGNFRTIIERVVNMFQGAGVTEIFVVAGHRAAEVRQAVAPLKVRCVENREYIDGMFTSVLAGVRALPAGCDAFFIHPVDIPLVRFQTVKRLAATLEDNHAGIIYPTFDGRRGHPTLIHTRLVPEILEWPGTGGLRGLLQRREAESYELPVADEAVLLDLDTPDDYSRLLARLVHEGLPSEEECRALMGKIQALPAPVVAHCRAVSAVALRLAEALGAAGFQLNSELVRTAALLHDIARTEKKHAEAGARMLETHGFPILAPIVATHMDLEVNTGRPVDEAQLVFLADKLVVGDQCVNVEQRFARKLEKYGGDPAVAARIMQRRESALRIQAEVERITGRDVDAITASAGLSDGVM
jgi:molybdenum cofactor cytidylyltransferase